MRTFIKKLKNSIIGKILKAIWKILIWAVEAVIIFIALIIVVQRVTNNEKAFLGFRIFNVATGSMEPTYAVGDILIAREKEPSKIEIGENIVYLGKVGDYNGKIITHSVVEIEQTEDGEYLFHSKGIANTVEDPVVHEDQVYGIVIQNNKLLAFICKILLNRFGLYFFVMVPIILNAFVSFVRVQGEKVEQEREEERKRKMHKGEKRRKVKKVEEPEEIEEPEVRRRKVKRVEEPEEIEAPEVRKKKRVKTVEEVEPEENIEVKKKTKKKTTAESQKVKKTKEE